MLARALHHDRVGALRASVAATYPGLPTLREIVSGRTPVTATDLADYVAHLPPGCPLWQEEGGWMAWSTEAQFLAFTLHGLDVLAWQNTGIMNRRANGSQPKPIKPPDSVAEVRKAAERLESKRENRAARGAARRRLRASD